jgi:5-methylcytosine-specific restriction endonuclease McrA
MEHPLPFDPDEILTARETFRRLSAMRRAVRAQQVETLRFGPPQAPAPLSPERRQELAELAAEALAHRGEWIHELRPLQKGKCYLCGGPFGDDGRKPTLEHVVPRALGGRNHRNVLLACDPCNRIKADRAPTADELAYLERINLLRYGV